MLAAGLGTAVLFIFTVLVLIGCLVILVDHFAGRRIARRSDGSGSV